MATVSEERHDILDAIYRRRAVRAYTTHGHAAVVPLIVGHLRGGAGTAYPHKLCGG